MQPPDRDCPDFAALAREGELDVSVLDQVLACFGKRLERFALFRCRDETLAQDALQDAMLSLIRNIDGYRGDAPIEPWLRKLVLSACGRLRRGLRNAPASNLPLEALGDEALASREPDPAALSALADEFARVECAIRALPEPNRSLLIRHEIDEEPLADLAAAFGLSVDAVKGRLKRSRQDLRERLFRFRE